MLVLWKLIGLHSDKSNANYDPSSIPEFHIFVTDNDNTGHPAQPRINASSTASSSFPSSAASTITAPSATPTATPSATPSAAPIPGGHMIYPLGMREPERNEGN